MTSRTVYEASVLSTGPTQIAAAIAAETVRQEAINQQGNNAGYHPGVSTGSSASYETAVRNANAAKFASLQAAEVAKQASLGVARDTLRNASDFGPV